MEWIRTETLAALNPKRYCQPPTDVLYATSAYPLDRRERERERERGGGEILLVACLGSRDIFVCNDMRPGGAGGGKCTTKVLVA